MLVVNCPICKKPVEWVDKSPFRPFCSERCKLIDLGEWATEERRIAGEDALFDDTTGADQQNPIRH